MTSAKSLGLLVMVVACGLIAGWFMLGMGEEPNQTNEPQSQSGAQTKGAETTTPESSSLTELPGAKTEKIDTIGSTPFEAESEQARKYAFTIRVVGVDDQPVAGAEVEVLDWVDTRDTFFSQESPAKVILLQSKSNAQGLVHLARTPKTGLKAVARKGGLEGQLTVSANSFELGGVASLKLLPRRKVVATVSDAGGSPIANAAVCMRRFRFDSQSGYGWTNNQGQAVFEVSPLDVDLYQRDQCEVRVSLQSGDKKSEPVDWAEEGPTQVSVVVESNCSTLVVRVLGEDGELDRGEHKISWKKDRRQGELDGVVIIDSLSDFRKPVTRTRTFKGGKVAFAGFAAGARISLDLETVGRVNVSKQVVMPDPTLPRHEVDMTRGAKAPVVVIPFTNKQGEPLAGKKFSVVIKRKLARSASNPMIFTLDGMDGQGKTMTVDSSGNLRLEMEANRATEVIVKEALRAVIWGGNKEALAVVKIPAVAAGETRTMEPVVIPEPPILVAGQVVDNAGVPQAGVLVRVLKFPREGEEYDWNISNRLNSLSARTAADGKFQLRSRVKTSGLHVLAMKSPAEQSEATPFDQGDDDLQITLHASGGIAVEVQRELPNQPMRVACRLSIGPDADTAGVFARDLRKSISLRPDKNSVEFSNLMPGVYEVEFFVGGVSVLTVEQVVVRPGEITRTARLLGVTPAKGWMVGTVTVRGPDSQPVKGATVLMLIPKEGGTGSETQDVAAETNASGVAERVCRIGTICDISVRTKQYLQFDQKQMTLPADVTLSSGASLDVMVDAGGPFPESERIKAWEVFLRPKSKEMSSEPFRSSGSFEGSSVVVSSSIVGPSEVDFRSAMIGDSHHRLSTKLTSGGEGTIRGIAPGDYEVRIKPVKTTALSSMGGRIMITSLGGGLRSGGLVIAEVSFPKGASGTRKGRYQVSQEWLLKQVAKAEGKDQN